MKNTNKVISALIEGTTTNRISWSQLDAEKYSFTLGSHKCVVYRKGVGNNITVYVFELNGVRIYNPQVLTLYVAVQKQSEKMAELDYNSFLENLLGEACTTS